MNPDSLPLFYTGRLEPEGATFDAWADRPLLQSIEAGGLSWPSSCQAGQCRSCVAQLLSGVVHYAEAAQPAALSEEERAAGLVLPCLVYPGSDVVLQPGD
jgi:ferredoxin